MHQTVQDFVARTLTREMVEGKRVLEVGSFDVNGSVRPYVMSLEPFEYLGVDAQPGKGVDKVADCENLAADLHDDTFDIVISTEMLEHVRDWRKAMIGLVDVVKPDGLLLITTRSPGFPYHPFPEDNWRYTRDQMWAILTTLQMVVLAIEDDPEPGVFALAFKPRGRAQHVPDVLQSLDVDRVEV